MDLSAFKAYDIRGKYPGEINEELAYKVGRALSRYLSAKTIVVGMDMRKSSQSLKEELIKGISCEGADVIDIGMCTTPMLYFAVASYDYDGGVMISASHNPGEYNAFKVVGKGADMFDETKGLPEVKEIVERGFTECPGRGAVTEKDVLSDYLSHTLSFFEGISDLKVVIDYGNGVGSVSGKPAFARLDVETVEMYDEPDGNFPNHPANPHDEVNFEDLSEKVATEGADIGIFFDGDADRAFFVDELGGIVPTDLMFVYFAKKALAGKKKENACPPETEKEEKWRRVYYDLPRFSKSVPEQIKKMGGNPVMLRVGNPFFKRALKEDGGVIGGEYSGHVMYAENYSIDDGLFASLKALELLSEHKEPLSKLIEKVKKYETSPEVSTPAKNPDTVLERVESEFPKSKKIELDGLYLDLSDGFISVRQSQNEPQLFRTRVEAKTKKTTENRLQKVLEIIKN